MISNNTQLTTSIAQTINAMSLQESDEFSKTDSTQKEMERTLATVIAFKQEINDNIEKYLDIIKNDKTGFADFCEFMNKTISFYNRVKNIQSSIQSSDDENVLSEAEFASDEEEDNLMTYGGGFNNKHDYSNFTGYEDGYYNDDDDYTDIMRGRQYTRDINSHVLGIGDLKNKLDDKLDDLKELEEHELLDNGIVTAISTNIDNANINASTVENDSSIDSDDSSESDSDIGDIAKFNHIINNKKETVFHTELTKFIEITNNNIDYYDEPSIE